MLLLNGPNLNLLGTREPHLYGRDTLAMIERRLVAKAKAAGVRLDCLQTNHEGAAVDRVQQAKRDGAGFIILNPADRKSTRLNSSHSLTSRMPSSA